MNSTKVCVFKLLIASMHGKIHCCKDILNIFFWYDFILNPTFFGLTKYFCTLNILGCEIFLYQILFWPHILGTQNCFWTKHFFSRVTMFVWFGYENISTLIAMIFDYFHFPLKCFSQSSYSLTFPVHIHYNTEPYRLPTHAKIVNY